MAERLRAGGRPGVARILNEVVLNQVLVRFEPAAAATPTRSPRAVVTRVQRDGTCWAGGTAGTASDGACGSPSPTGRRREEDIDRSAHAILRLRARGSGDDGGEER